MECFQNKRVESKAGGIVKPVGIMHLIDSLDAGGAERMAVNIVNHLPRSPYEIHLCATRKEGPLRSELLPHVKFFCLNRRFTFDLTALWHLIRYIRKHHIVLLHAHSTSLFLAVAAKFFSRFPKIIWHDHWGRGAVGGRLPGLYRFMAAGVSGVIAVDPSLVEWSRDQLKIERSHIWLLPNFVSDPEDFKPVSDLPGQPGYRIVCLANLRPEKDHITLLRAAGKVVKQISGAHLFLVGKAFDPVYFHLIKQEIARLHLSKNVSLLGAREDIWGILRSSDIGVLSSALEAFPLALLEYGAAGLPVIATRVGSCAEILEEGGAGILVPPGDSEKLAEALLSLLGSSEERKIFGQRLRLRVKQNYSSGSVIQRIGRIYDILLGPSIPEAR